MNHKKSSGKSQQPHTQTGQEFGHVHQAQDREQHDRNQLGNETHKSGEVKSNEKHNQPQKHTALDATGMTIYIDHNPYHVASDTFSGADLRKMLSPPIGADRDIFRVVSGTGDDIKLDDSDVIAVNMRASNEGRHFFSDTIIPTKDAVARKAYFIYLNDGSKPGRDAQNWAEAESQIDPRKK